MPVLSIDGKEVEARAGASVLQAARDAGIYIPSLCYHPKLGKAGNCRVCVVEVEGMPGLQLSCMTEVKAGMVVRTETKAVSSARRVVVELLLAAGEHDLSDPDENELARVARYLGIEQPRYPKLEVDHPVDDSHPILVYDESKCIRCARCIRACSTTVVNEVLDLAYRGLDARVVADADVPWRKSTCVACGECIQVCPTGALVDKRHYRKKSGGEVDKVETVCPYCGVGCKVELHVDRDANRIVKAQGVEHAATNEGMLCVKGRFGYDFVGSSERLTSPLVRNQRGEFDPVAWDTAFSLVAARFREIKETHGGDAVAGLASAKCTNEENYVFQKFMRKEVGTNNVDHCARL